MRNLCNLIWQIGCVASLLASAAMAQNPVYSLELAEINSVPISGGGVSEMLVKPYDILVAKVYLRDWSPGGEELRAYQAELNHSGFTTGTSGSVRPIGYQSTTLQGYQNLKNVFIDLIDPAYVHGGEQAIAFADTDQESPGYRWISVLFKNGGPVSRQDGTKYYCGTLKLVVSEDAEGTFTIGLWPGLESTTLRTPEGNWIEPLDLEPLTLTVVSGERPAWISTSIPTHGSVDARSLSPDGDGGWKVVELTFSAEPGPMGNGDFTIEDGSGAPPQITGVESSGKAVKVEFDRPISSMTWTTITHNASGTKMRIGRFPGDVNNDGIADSHDLSALIEGLNGIVDLPAYRVDVDGSGVAAAPDVLRLIDVLSEG